MKFSLLYRDPNTAEPIRLDEKLLYDLSLDKAVSSFCPRPKRAAYFTDVLASPAQTLDDITYRQDILKDFISNGKLLDNMKLIFNRYDKIIGDWEELRRNVYPSDAGGGYRALLDYTYSQMQVTATFTKTIVAYLKSFGELLENADIHSMGLCNIRGYCREMTRNKALDEVAEIASLFQYRSPDDYRFTVSVTMDEALRATGCELTDITDCNSLKKDSLLKKFFSKKQDTNETKLGDTESDDALYVLNEALRRTHDALSDIADGVYELFYGLSREFMFYDAAVLYVEMLEQNGVTYTFPEILDESSDTFRAKELRDLILCCDPDRVVTANDVRFESHDSGMLIRGRNNTGKTVFLRSVALAQIFAQSGLPVCAENAQISIRSMICAHFSSAEEELREGDVAGRFEGEVQLIADIVNKLRPHGLVFFNETFQTTSYDEGTKAIGSVLALLAKLNIQFVFVTHLTGLFDEELGGVRRMETDEGVNRFKLREISADFDTKE